MLGNRRNKTPVYKKIQSEIRRRIASASLKPGDAVSSERELAKTQKVSLMTARRALAGLESEGIVERLRAVGVNMKEERKAPLSAKFAGKTFVFTGTLTKRSREAAEALVASHGGKAGSTVSKKTSYVVVGADPGSKFDKAKSLNVPILDEAAFEKLLAAR